MDGELRDALWNAVLDLLRQLEVSHLAFVQLAARGPSPPEMLLERIWIDFRHAARDMFGHVDPLTDLRQWFYAAQWNEVYDLLEFIASLAGGAEFEDACNAALANENAAYRIVEGSIIELTDEQQLRAIEDALAAADNPPAVHEHLRTAVARLADRPEPDCRNAMNEAISGLEALVGMISGSPKATLDAGLKLIDSRRLLPAHASLIKSWGALYGYASDAGVRHGRNVGQPDLALEDALYFVVSCSAIVSYLIALARKTGVQLT